MGLLDTLPSFLLYFASALALFATFTGVYLQITPYPEWRLIREGNLAAVIALLGSLIGFALPLASCIANSVSLRDMLVWGVIALLIQGLVFLVLMRLMPELKDGIIADNPAHGLMLGGCSLCIGLLNAACMVY